MAIVISSHRFRTEDSWFPRITLHVRLFAHAATRLANIISVPKRDFAGLMLQPSSMNPVCSCLEVGLTLLVAVV
jgi:hypothetical protein